MLKYFVFFIVFVLFPVTVNAEKIYSDEYYYFGDNDVLYPFIDENDYIIKTYSSDIKLEEIKGRTLISETPYVYKEFGVRYIVLNGFKFINSTFLREIEIFNNDELISYTYKCSMCGGDMSFNLNNGIYYEDISKPMYASFTMLIDLGDYYNPDSFEFVFTFANPKEENINVKYNLWMLKDEPNEYLSISKYDDAIIYRNDKFVSDFSTDLYKSFSFFLEDKDIKNKVYDRILFSDTFYNNSFYELIVNKTYIYQDKLFKYYKIVSDNSEKIVSIKKDIGSENINSKSNNIDDFDYVSSDYYDVDIVSVDEKNDNVVINDINKKEKTYDVEIKESNNLSDNIYVVKPYYDIKLPFVFGIFLVLISIMIFAIYKLKKESWYVRYWHGI